MNPRLERLATLGILCLLGGAGTAEVAHGAQARSSAITTWTMECSGGARDWWDDMCMAWRKKMGTKGWGQWKANYDKVIVSRYVDPAVAAWGFDNAANGFDRGQASLLCTHGGYDDTGWWGLMHHKDQGECGANVDQLKYGQASGGTSRFLHLSSCNSMRWSKAGAWFGPAAGGVHSIEGFHGLMYIGWGYVGEYEDMVSDAFSGQSVAESWVNHMHHDPIIGPTICPVAMAFGKTKAGALSRLFHERYNTSSAEVDMGYGVLMWISQCDPESAGALPN